MTPIRGVIVYQKRGRCKHFLELNGGLTVSELCSHATPSMRMAAAVSSQVLSFLGDMRRQLGKEIQSAEDLKIHPVFGMPEIMKAGSRFYPTSPSPA